MVGCVFLKIALALNIKLVSALLPGTGLLAVLSWAAVIALVVLAPVYFASARRSTKQALMSAPRDINLYLAYVSIMVMAAIVLLATHAVQGT